LPLRKREEVQTLLFECPKKVINPETGKCRYLRESGVCTKPDELMCRELYPDQP